VLPLALGACGGEATSSTDAAKPALNPAVASRLAAASDAIAESLDQGDVCTAAGRADDLHEAVVEAINNGQVPPEFQEELGSRASELVNEVNCPPPPPPEDENGKDKKDKKDKKKDESGGDQTTVPADTVVTDTTPTDTTDGG
jgi:hypothetical protein